MMCAFRVFPLGLCCWRFGQAIAAMRVNSTTLVCFVGSAHFQQYRARLHVVRYAVRISALQHFTCGTICGRCILESQRLVKLATRARVSGWLGLRLMLRVLAIFFGCGCRVCACMLQDGSAGACVAADWTHTPGAVASCVCVCLCVFVFVFTVCVCMCMCQFSRQHIECARHQSAAVALVVVRTALHLARLTGSWLSA